MRHLVLAVFVAATAPLPSSAAENPKNIIIMIADGAGHNTLAATRFWKGGPLAVDTGPWVRASMATYALRSDAKKPVGGDPSAQDPDLVYDSTKAWDTRPVAGNSKYSEKYPALFAGYEWNRRTHPDSANTMSAMMTGVRSYNGAINVNGAGTPVRSAAEAAKAAGKMTGSISSVPFNHATPASGGGAHNTSRENYHDLAREMFTSGTLDVIGGGGNPDFDSDGEPLSNDAEAERFQWISKELWQELKSPVSKWKLVQSAGAIVALANGAARSELPLAMIAETGTTLQAQRAFPKGTAKGAAAPGEVPLTPGMANLSDMARAALRHVGTDPDGFFMQIEGGAVDWAMHGNDLGRMIEEYLAFDDAVRAVIAWVESPESAASWEDTLLVVTADHDHLLYGSDSKVAFQRVVNQGAGNLPGHSWAWNWHSNQLVPFFARGTGASELLAKADQHDAYTDSAGRKFGYGRYLTQTELGAYLVGNE